VVHGRVIRAGARFVQWPRATADRGPRLLVMTPMTYLVRRPAAAGSILNLVALLLIHCLAHGQTAPVPAGGDTGPGVSERVKKEAAGPLYWIRLNAQKADTTPAKPPPRIAEIKLAAPARTAPSPAGGGGNATSTAASGSLAGGAVPASAGPAAGSAVDATSVLAAPGALAAPNPAAAMPSAAAAGLVAPAAAPATEAARAATAPPPDDEPDEPLALVKAGEPEFPISVMRRLRKGTVQVRFEVRPDGSVSNVTVVQTTHRSLNEAAIEAVNGWQFKPVRGSRNAVVDLGFDLDS